MNKPIPSFHAARPHTPHPSKEKGVVLIVSLIVLVVISMLAITSLRNVSSSEMISGNVRTTELANQAAEFALRYCEKEVENFKNGLSNITINDYSDPPLWSKLDNKTNSLVNWEGANSAGKVNILDGALLNQANITYATYKRLPECMIEVGEDKPKADASVFKITARGFGPEVSAADNNRTRPVGTEVWLQSTITFN
ncbi:PilX N-terminal domain-containing pilus assembly protein [Rhodoferax sp.]|uniref:pilus assembly PilX family protein n=1 Tax=Rhodoferax sp. TaxID=50421 RepID=UPI00262B4EBA|nr:PilX N-terminal domain-containing pilus assembly protein [Rhodoferax sp.]MDD2810921.1 hypothetical protein [Rhodoferax sp.]MDD5480403.1 hypothetical protein [Rhodoferax sp.]